MLIIFFFFLFPGICKGLILGLGSMEDRIPCSLCTALRWTTTLNFHSSELLIGLRYLPSTSLGHSLNIYLLHGLGHQPLRVPLGMAIQRPWWLLSILTTLVPVPRLPYTCILLSTLVSALECLSSTLMNKFTNLFHRYDNSQWFTSSTFGRIDIELSSNWKRHLFSFVYIRPSLITQICRFWYTSVWE